MLVNLCDMSTYVNITHLHCKKSMEIHWDTALFHNFILFPPWRNSANGRCWTEVWAPWHWWHFGRPCCTGIDAGTRLKSATASDFIGFFLVYIRLHSFCIIAFFCIWHHLTFLTSHGPQRPPTISSVDDVNSISTAFRRALVCHLISVAFDWAHSIF